MTTKRWQGDATPVANVWTLTPGGTIGTETFTVTINGKTVSYTAESGDAVAEVCAGLTEAWNSTDDPAPPEFRELTAVDGTTLVTVTGNTAGVPHTITSAATGSATLVASEATAATGPHHFDNATNWSGGAAPANSDVLVFDSGDVPVKYGLSTSLTGLTIKILDGYRGYIGLPDANTDGDYYAEYRTQYLTIDGATLILMDSADATKVRINTGSTAATVNINNTIQPADAEPIFLWKGAHSSNAVTVSKGSVGIAYFSGETATVATLRVGYIDNLLGDANVICGSGVTFTDIDQSGGVLVIDSATATIGMIDGDLTILSAAHASIDCDGGVIHYQGSGTCTAAIFRGGLLDCSRDMRGRTFTDLALHKGSGLRDPSGTLTVTNGIDFHSGVHQLSEFTWGTYYTLTKSSI